MEYHYIVVYDSDTKTWGIEDGMEGYMPDGTVWDNDTQEWLWPDPDNYPRESALDERAYTMLRTLASIWPEVYDGD